MSLVSKASSSIEQKVLGRIARQSVCESILMRTVYDAYFCSKSNQRGPSRAEQYKVVQRRQFFYQQALVRSGLPLQFFSYLPFKKQRALYERYVHGEAVVTRGINRCIIQQSSSIYAQAQYMKCMSGSPFSSKTSGSSVLIRSHSPVLNRPVFESPEAIVSRPVASSSARGLSTSGLDEFRRSGRLDANIIATIHNSQFPVPEKPGNSESEGFSNISELPLYKEVETTVDSVWKDYMYSFSQPKHSEGWSSSTTLVGGTQLDLSLMKWQQVQESEVRILVEALAAKCGVSVELFTRSVLPHVGRPVVVPMLFDLWPTAIPISFFHPKYGHLFTGLFDKRGYDVLRGYVYQDLSRLVLDPADIVLSSTAKPVKFLSRDFVKVSYDTTKEQVTGWTVVRVTWGLVMTATFGDVLWEMRKSNVENAVIFVAGNKFLELLKSKEVHGRVIRSITDEQGNVYWPLHNNVSDKFQKQ